MKYLLALFSIVALADDRPDKVTPFDRSQQYMFCLMSYTTYIEACTKAHSEYSPPETKIESLLTRCHKQSIDFSHDLKLCKDVKYE